MIQPRLTALIAYRPTRDGHRDEAWRRIVHPYLEIVCDQVIAVSPSPGDDPDEFNKPAAINRARERAGRAAEILLIGDADTHPGSVRAMADELAAAYWRTPWMLPERYCKLTREATHEILYGPARPRVPEDVEWMGEGVCWSGGVVCWAQDFDDVGGMDERFEKWGADDVAFGLTMNALTGPVVRHPCAATHYWHPAAPDRAQPAAQHDLTQRYMAAAGASDPRDAIHAVRFG